MMNEITLVGYVGRDPDYTVGSTNRAFFSLATTDNYSKKDGTSVETTYWHDCVAWGKLAELCNNMVQRGTLVFVRGKLVYWETEDEGKKMKRANIKVDSFWVLKGGKEKVQDFGRLEHKPPTQVNLSNQDNVLNTAKDFEPDDLPF